MQRVRALYLLTKPGIIRGNLVTALAGFLLASKAAGSIEAAKLLATLAGVMLIIAAACVCNNYMDRGIDKLMSRTKKRAAWTDTISMPTAMVYAFVLGVSGLIALAYYDNLVTAGLGVLAFVFYVVIYGIAKRKSVHGTLVGTIPGALPPVAGYTAVSGHIDMAAILLFLILVFWQLPHFYAIAIYRREDYANAHIPVMPVYSGIPHTKVAIMLYTIAFTITAPLLSLYGYTGAVFGCLAALAGVAWLWLGWHGFRGTDDVRWAKTMFFFSLLVITVISGGISADALLS